MRGTQVDYMPIVPWVYDEVDLSNCQNLGCHYHESYFHQDCPLQILILSFYPVTRVRTCFNYISSTTNEKKVIL